jgi:hypothetical protein
LWLFFQQKITLYLYFRFPFSVSVSVLFLFPSVPSRIGGQHQARTTATPCFLPVFGRYQRIEKSTCNTRIASVQSHTGRQAALASP